VHVHGALLHGPSILQHASWRHLHLDVLHSLLWHHVLLLAWALLRHHVHRTSSSHVCWDPSVHHLHLLLGRHVLDLLHLLHADDVAARAHHNRRACRHRARHDWDTRHLATSTLDGHKLAMQQLTVGLHVCRARHWLHGHNLPRLLCWGHSHHYRLHLLHARLTHHWVGLLLLGLLHHHVLLLGLLHHHLLLLALLRHHHHLLLLALWHHHLLLWLVHHLLLLHGSCGHECCALWVAHRHSTCRLRLQAGRVQCERPLQPSAGRHVDMHATCSAHANPGCSREPWGTSKALHVHGARCRNCRRAKPAVLLLLVGGQRC
jgi:hypothetical protein